MYIIGGKCLKKNKHHVNSYEAGLRKNDFLFKISPTTYYLSVRKIVPLII